MDAPKSTSDISAVMFPIRLDNPTYSLPRTRTKIFREKKLKIRFINIPAVLARRFFIDELVRELSFVIFFIPFKQKLPQAIYFIFSEAKI